MPHDEPYQQYAELAHHFQTIIGMMLEYGGWEGEADGLRKQAIQLLGIARKLKLDTPCLTKLSIDPIRYWTEDTAKGAAGEAQEIAACIHADGVVQRAEANADPFTEQLRLIDDAIGKYAALRPKLFQQVLSLKNLPGGPWRIQYKRDPAKGDPSLPVKYSHFIADMKADLKGGTLNGMAAVRKPETYADFHDFALLDPAGNGPADGSDAQAVELRLKFLLEELLKTMKALAGGLAWMEAHSRSLAVDTMPLSRLALALPVFPYWQATKGMTQGDYDRIIAEEKPLLDEARLTLHRLKTVAALRRLYVNDAERMEWMKRFRSIVAKYGVNMDDLRDNDLEQLAYRVGIPAERIGPGLSFAELEAAVIEWARKEGEGKQTNRTQHKADGSRKRRKRTERPLTNRQGQALELYGELNGDIKAIAGKMGITRQAVDQSLKAAWKKLPGYAPTSFKAGRQAMPQDRRGQNNIGVSDNFDDIDDRLDAEIDAKRKGRK